MQLLSSTPFWPIRDGLPASYPALEEDLACDVVILGAGISGALAAWHLAAAGVDTVVLDRRDVAHGSTAGSTSLLQYEIDEPLHRLARRFGADRAARCYRRCREAIYALERLARDLRIDCGFERKRSLFLASGRAHLPRLEREYAARRAAGFAVEWWPRAKLAAASTLPHPAAILSRDGAQLDAYGFTHGLLAAAQRAGARICDRTPVVRTSFRARGVELRTAGGSRVRARHLVAATGYEAESFLPRRHTALQSTYALVSEPVAAFPGWPAGRCLIWETADPYVYLRTTADGRVIIGGYDEPFSDPKARDRLEELRPGALRGAPEGQGQREFPAGRQVDLAGQGDVAVVGAGVFPIHLEIIHQVLPAVAAADVADRAAGEAGRAAEDHVDVLALAAEDRPAADVAPAGRIVLARSLEVRGEEGEDAQLAPQLAVGDFQPGAHEEDGRVRVADHLGDEAVTALALGVGHPVEQGPGFRALDQVVQVALFLMAEGLPVRDQELQVARVRRVDMGIVDLVDDAVAEREPEG